MINRNQPHNSRLYWLTVPIQEKERIVSRSAMLTQSILISNKGILNDTYFCSNFIFSHASRFYLLLLSFLQLLMLLLIHRGLSYHYTRLSGGSVYHSAHKWYAYWCKDSGMCIKHEVMHYLRILWGFLALWIMTVPVGKGAGTWNTDNHIVNISFSIDTHLILMHLFQAHKANSKFGVIVTRIINLALTNGKIHNYEPCSRLLSRWPHLPTIL